MADISKKLLAIVYQVFLYSSQQKKPQTHNKLPGQYVETRPERKITQMKLKPNK
ncbi:hypothetical protein HPP92_015753 [Vanilla planifolia]|uniref:Uncharacterized protein n=1 Tax=Vanilla planifolia TaxID=51239 RepID=A0A835QHE9_VANPL|nr:hypothetical protein HPP92_016364 [Vanilla planifolia]KAG0471207.1 hypothetical protein HPP92_015753 [Vanilla planifolia]